MELFSALLALFCNRTYASTVFKIRKRCGQTSRLIFNFIILKDLNKEAELVYGFYTYFLCLVDSLIN